MGVRLRITSAASSAAGVLVAVALVGCGGGGKADAELGVVQTPAGTYTIARAERTERFPIACSNDCFIGPGESSTNHLEEGFDLVAVFVEANAEAAEEASPFGCPGKATYVVADDGSRHSCAAEGIARADGDELEQSMLFAVPVTAKGFTLYLKGNPPIALGM